MEIINHLIIAASCFFDKYFTQPLYVNPYLHTVHLLAFSTFRVYTHTNDFAKWTAIALIWNK